MSKKTINLFYSYAHEDEALRDTLETHLTLLKRQHVIDMWHDRNISSGTEWDKAIDENLEAADIILLLISADFLASDYCWDIEIQRAMQRHKEKSAVVIPVLLRPCDTCNAEFMTLQGLPANFKAVTTWANQDKAFTDIAKGIRTAAEKIRNSQQVNPSHDAGTAPVGLFSVPFADDHFIGREQELKRLNKLFLTSNKVALTGLGGVGKTRLAVHYAYQQKPRCAFILWVSASSKASLDTSLSQLADQLNADPLLKQAEKMAFVKAWLEQHNDWLLIIDNADNDQEITAKVLESFLPVSPQGHILFTTQIITADLKFKAAALEIKCLDTETGGLFLWRRIHADKQATPDELIAAKEISGALSGLPLALVQAAAYIKENQCALNDYLPLYEKYAKELLNPDLSEHQQVISDHDLPVFATFKLSFSRLQEPAKELLAFCALLHAENIPEEILTNAFAVDDFALNQRLKPVLQYGLLVRNAQDKTLALHRLVQQVLLLDMADPQKQHDAEQAVLAMNEILPAKFEFKDWQRYERSLQSGLACAKWITHYQLETEQAAWLLNQMAIYLYRAKADYTIAEPLYERSLRIYEKVLGEDDPNVATSLNNLAVLYHVQGKYEQAEPLYERSLAIDEKALGKDHPDLAIDLNNLASLYQAQGKYEQAEPLFERSLAFCEYALGKDHPDVASSLNNLALLYDAQGQYEQAEPLYQRSLAIKEKALGKDHPAIATSLNNLAALYYAQGKYEQAEPLFERSLAIREKALGKDHPDTKQVRKNYELFLAEKAAGK